VSSRFATKCQELPPQAVAQQIQAVTVQDVERVLAGERIRPQAAPVLFSEVARPFLEQMAQRARATTLQRFGRTITLYAPVYLSNYCTNRCLYCGFAAQRPIERRDLTLPEAVRQVEFLLKKGIRHLLLVTGEAPRRYGLEAICEVVSHLRPRLASIAVEIFPCNRDQYQKLIAAGVDSLVLYQETYDPEIYARLHPAGPKKDFVARLEAVEAGGHAGFRSLGIGALLGLAPPRVDACYLAWHAAHLTHCFPSARLALSFPRLRPIAGGLQDFYAVSDAEMVQFIVGMRLMFPDAELVVSTRESPRMRDRLLHLGITRMSAGSRTSPGGYDERDEPDLEGSQFVIDDNREVEQVAQAIRTAGFDVVTKDFDANFLDR
jgi:2-iminoacetate synthase